jgi:hypothetical protein
MTDNPVSYVGPMSEDDYLATVERIQQAMAIEPFRPPLIDVVKLLSDWRDLSNQNERLREVEIKSLEAECDAHIETIERLRHALVQIENWVGKLPSNMGEAALIFEYIEKACAVLDRD